MSRYTSLLVTERGVVLFAQHLARLAPEGPEVLAAYRAFAKSAAPGAYALRAANQQLEVIPRPPSALADGMPSRFLISPFSNQPASFVKPTPPSLYDSVRIRGVATFLTSPDETELYEESVSSVIAWDGQRLITPPENRPVVRSTAISALLEADLIDFGSIRIASTQPLALVNAVAGIVVPAVPGREEFPSAQKAAIAELFARSARREG